MTNRDEWRLALITGLLACVGFVLFSLHTCSATKDKQDNQNIHALTDSTKFIKNKDSTTTTIVTAFVGTSPREFLSQIHTKDSMINELQNLVKHYKGKLDAAATFHSNTTIEGSAPTIVDMDSTHWLNIYTGNTIDTTHLIQTDSLGILHLIPWPIYNSVISNKWYNAIISSTRDSSTINLAIYDEYDVTIGKEKGKYYGIVHPHNPNTIVTDAKVYINQVPQSQWGIDVTGGVGIQERAGIITYGPQVTIGISKHLINFK